MADYTVIISDLPDHKRGDQWIGIAGIGPVTVNGYTPNDHLDRIRMRFKHTATGKRFDVDSEDGEVLISDAVLWSASIPPLDCFLPLAGSWEWDMEFYPVGHTTPLTFYKGIITVHQDV